MRTILVDARLCGDVASVRRALPSIIEAFEIEEHVMELAVNGMRSHYSSDAANNVDDGEQREAATGGEEHSEASAMGEHTSCIESSCQYMVDGTTTKMLVEHSAKNRCSGDSRRLEECRRALVDAAFAYAHMSKILHPLFAGGNNIPFDNKDGCSDAPWMIKDTIDKGMSPVLDEAMRGDVNECLWMLQQTNEGRWWIPTHPNSVRKYDVDGILEHIVSGEIHAVMVVVPTMGRSKKLAGLRGLSVAFAADALGLYSLGNMNVVIGTSDVHLNAKRVAALRDIGVEIIYDYTGELVPDAAIPSEMFSFEFNGDMDSLPTNVNVYDDVLKPTYHGEVPEWVFNYYRSIRATEWITGQNGFTWLTHWLGINNRWKQYALVLTDYVRRGRVATFTSLGADWAKRWQELIENHPYIYYDNAVEHNATLLRGINIPAVDEDVKHYFDTFCCYCYELGNVWGPACERFRIRLDLGFDIENEVEDEMMENIVEIAETLGIAEQIREAAALGADEVLRRVEAKLGGSDDVEAAAVSNYLTA